MNGQAPEPGPSGERRPFTRMESFFMFLCVVLPGIAGAGFAYAGFLWVFESRGDGYLELGITAAVFLAFVAACSWFAATLSAAKSGAEGGRKRVIRSTLLFFLLQIFLAPAIGWGTCAGYIQWFAR